MKLEDLKIGMFVRFKDKRGNTYIRKIKEVCNEKPEKLWGAIIVDKDANNVPYVSLKNIIKARFNVINLIEVGDILVDDTNRKLEVLLIDNKLMVMNTGLIYDNNYYLPIEDIKIKSIVTKEQFEQMSYEL